MHVIWTGIALWGPLTDATRVYDKLYYTVSEHSDAHLIRTFSRNKFLKNGSYKEGDPQGDLPTYGPIERAVALSRLDLISKTPLSLKLAPPQRDSLPKGADKT